MKGLMKWTSGIVWVVAILLPACNQPIKDIPLALHPENPHYFLYKNQPAILITSGEHYGAVLNLDFDFVAYLEELSSSGLNLTRTFTGAYLEPPGAFPGCVGALKQDTSAPAKFFGASAGPLFVAPEPLSGTPGSQFVAPGSLSDTPDSLFVAPGSLFVAPGALFVAPGSLSGTPGSLFVTPEALWAGEVRPGVPFP